MRSYSQMNLENMYVSIVSESPTQVEAICVEPLHELVEDFDESMYDITPSSRPGRQSHFAIAIRKNGKWIPKDDSEYSRLLAENIN